MQPELWCDPRYIRKSFWRHTLSGDGAGGTTYQLMRQNGSWFENILADGSHGTGSNPSGTLVMDPSGVLYGFWAPWRPERTCARLWPFEDGELEQSGHSRIC